MFMSSDGGQDAGVSTRLLNSNVVGGVGDGGVRGNTMPWSSTSGRTGMSIGVEQGNDVNVGGIGKDHRVWCVSKCVLLE
jgi:hypothetical protein